MAKSPVGDRTTEELARQEFERLLTPYTDWTFEQLHRHLGVTNEDHENLSFDPHSAAHYEAIHRGLKMTDEEQAKFRANGLVVVDPKQRDSFASVYYQIYASHLPVLITTDSVLHAWHRSYTNLLQELEENILMPELRNLLEECHEQLAANVDRPDAQSMLNSKQDVDLYLTVARNLLAGAGSQKWSGRLIVNSHFGMDDQVRKCLGDIKSLKQQVQYPPTESTKIYGGERYVDYSQFQPRGHYTHGPMLPSYFRCMMWLGRADCGFNVLPVDPKSGLVNDWRRELLNAVLLSKLVRDSNNDERLVAMTSTFQWFGGESDNLNVSGMLGLLDSAKITDVVQFIDEVDDLFKRFASVIDESKLARQRVRSQAIASPRGGTYKVPPPSLFQMFGQAFTVDSFLLSQVVFDSIVFDGVKQKRMMPTGLDVAASLGNDFATRLLESELRKWNYSANLLANRDFVDQLEPEFWKGNVYHGWLDALRTLDDPCTSGSFPEVMQRPAWHAKQLQTQLASWAELRHDNVLYAKESYTSVPDCEYPDGFVEPYPMLYARLGELARRTATALESLSLSSRSNQGEVLQQQVRTQERQLGFLRRFAEIMDQLEAISTQELASLPMTLDQRRFIETTVDVRGPVRFGSGSRALYDGWYCELLYNQVDASARNPHQDQGLTPAMLFNRFDPDPSAGNPIVVDVHRNPTDHETLHVGVGDANLAVIAIDNQDDVAAYVGPVYSYYEFTLPNEETLYDERWHQLIEEDKLPPRPKWAESILATPTLRSYDGRSLYTHDDQWVLLESSNGKLKTFAAWPRNDKGLQALLEELEAGGYPARFGISLGHVTSEGLKSLVDVRQLSYVDATDSGIPKETIEGFRQRRPDVEVLPQRSERQQ